jgi:hypothetical protein
MQHTITVFIPYFGNDSTHKTITNLRNNSLIKEIILLVVKKSAKSIDGIHAFNVEYLWGSKSIDLIKERSTSIFTMLLTQDNFIEISQFALERLTKVAEDTGAGLVYSDYNEFKNKMYIPHPTLDYQLGSIRNDFDMGYIYLINNGVMKESLEEQIKEDYRFAGLYDLRLKISQNFPIIRVPEFLYSIKLDDARNFGDKIFDYVDPKNRAVQIEMETACTNHLKSIGAYLEPKFETVDFNEGDFEVEASVVIPVKNRIKTIREAVDSTMKQKTQFQFNIIVVDNYSNDGTTDFLKSLAKKDGRLILIIPERKDLGIGGCWNEAVNHPQCGKFVIQLDSDDVYKDETTIQKIINKFYEEKCAMVVGSYIITNFKLEEIPPGTIDHKEWTPDNGRNNALRINGLGAPRAFYTPVLRKIKFPNVSYGEDYAVALAISRDYRIGRIYEPIYLCRRWEENSDASPDINKQNQFNFYKDRLRSFEIIARQRKNSL